MLPYITYRYRIIIASVAGLLVIVLFVLHPLARGLARSSARARGWIVQIDSTRFGVRGLWFRSVRAHAESVPSLRAQLHAVLVPWRDMFGKKDLAVFGGEVVLPSNLDELNQGLRRTTQKDKSERASRFTAKFVGVTLRWQANDNLSRLSAWGITGEANQQTCAVTADRIEAGSARLNGLVTHLSTSLAHTHEGWVLQKAEAARAHVVLTSIAHPQEQNRKQTGQVPQRKSNKATVTVEEPQTDALERVTAGLVQLQHQTESLREVMARRLATSAVVDLQEVNLRWQSAEQKLEIGPLHARLSRKAESTECLVEQNADANAGRRYLMLRVPNQPSRIELDADIGPVALQTLGIKENDLGLRGVAESKVAMAMKMSFDELDSTARWEAKGELVDINLTQPWLAPRPVEGIQAAFSGSGQLRWKPEFLLQIQNLSCNFGKARVEVAARLERKASDMAANITVDVPLAACEDLVEALPRGLAPIASQVRLDGTLSLQSAVKFDTARPSAAEVQWKLSNGCRVKSVAAAVSPDRFRAPFILEVPDEHAVFVQHAFGPGTPNWFAIADMSSHLAHAVSVCEDGGFYRHNGFDAQAIRNSIRANLVQGRFARGASTVSMQLAKNLYLRREKTFSRKLQEAVLTVLLEQSFTKDELMELYLNVVELGPGIYGVGEASRVYFNTTPAVLSPLQAYYLISLLPNPKVVHFEKDGRVSPGWLKLVRHLMTIANKRHYLTDEELKVALQEELRFGVADSGANVQDSALHEPESDAMMDVHDATE